MSVAKKKVGQLTALMKYFGRQPGQLLSGFQEECAALSDAEKLELAQGAARNLGLTQDEVDFPLA